MPPIIIRHYQAGDRDALYQIAADTAFFGEPVEAFLDDRNLFCDAFVGFYLSHKANFSWVAENEGKVIGYLLGSNQIVTQSSGWIKYMFSHVIIPAIKLQYKIRKRTINYVMASASGYLHGEEPPVDLDTYPAHLHINVSQEFRGHGVGRQLIEAYLDQLSNLGIRGVYLHTTSQNLAACRLYEKLGFQLLSSRPNQYWSKWFGFRVDNRSYGIKLV